MSNPLRLALSLIVLSGCAEAHSATPRCTPGMSVACSCTDGRSGAQDCAEEGRFEPCVCTGPILPTTDAGGGVDAGMGDGSTRDAFTPDRDAASGEDAHVVPVDAAFPPFDSGPCLIPETEWCDGRDNDCDGAVDDGEVCPDATIAYTETFTGGVWFLGTTAEGSCGADALQQFWPTLASTYRTGFDCYADWFVIRASDAAIFYTATFSGLRRDASTATDPVVDTPPCFDRVRDNVGFDATDTLYYQCDATLRRGNGDLLASDVGWLEAVLPSGRTVVGRGAGSSATFALLDVDGTEISTPDLGGWVGEMTALRTSSSVQGESAWVLFSRTYSGARQEAVVMRVDGATGAWRKVRRVELDAAIGQARIALPDGRVFGMRRDATTTFDYEFLEYPPDGPMRVAWREASVTEVRLHIGDQFMIGPRL